MEVLARSRCCMGTCRAVWLKAVLMRAEGGHQRSLSGAGPARGGQSLKTLVNLSKFTYFFQRR